MNEITTAKNKSLIPQYRKELEEAIIANEEFIKRIPQTKRENFKDNFLELANNTYLMQNITDKTSLIKLAINLTNIGLDVNPFAKQVSIVPFGGIPQAVVHLKGKQEEYFNMGFLLKVIKVWEIEKDNVKREDEMSYKELAQIKETDPNYRNKHFVGWVVILEDLKKELPTQEKFVSYEYAKAASKNKSTPEKFEIEGLIHSAVRHAEKYFVIPEKRRSKLLDEIEKINVEILEENHQQFNQLENKTYKDKKKLLASELKRLGLVTSDLQKRFADFLKDNGINIYIPEGVDDALNNFEKIKLLYEEFEKGLVNQSQEELELKAE